MDPPADIASLIQHEENVVGSDAAQSAELAHKSIENNLKKEPVQQQEEEMKEGAVPKLKVKPTRLLRNIKIGLKTEESPARFFNYIDMYPPQ